MEVVVGAKAVEQLQTMTQNGAVLPKAIQSFLARNPQQPVNADPNPAWRVNWEERWITNYPDPRP